MKRLSVAFAVLLLSTAMWGQSNIGQISGTVADATGKMVGGAQITATDPATGVAQKTISEKSGYYIFPSLKPGTYTLTLDKTGFGTWTQRGVTLDAAANQTVNFKIVMGTGNHEVALGSQQQVETTSGQVAGTIDNKKIDNVGMNGRNFQSLLGLLPGTATATLDPFALGLTASGYSVNGVRGSAMLTAVDGISLLDPNTNNFVQSVPNPDTISEMRVLASSYMAENPSLSGAYVNIITKTGTKAFHGNIFEYIRNDAFDAKSDFALVKQPLHFNDFGGTLGGPIYIPGKFNVKKDKLFFFIAEEWKYNHKGVTNLDVVPTTGPDSQAMGIFTTPVFQPGTYKPATKTTPASGTPYTTCPQDPAKVGYCIPNTVWSPLGKAMLAAYPKPNILVGGSNYSVTGVNIFENREDRYNVDYMVKPQTTLSVRYTYSTNHASNPFANDGLGVIPATDDRPTRIGSVSLSHFFSPTTMNNLSVAINYAHWQTSPVNQAVLLSNAGLSSAQTQIFPGDAYGGAYPKSSITGLTALGSELQNERHTKLLQITDDFTKVWGKHALKFGFMEQKASNSEVSLIGATSSGQAAFSTSATNSTGNAIADVFAGNFSTYTETSSAGIYTTHYYETELYAQDTWKVNKKLGISYGLRYNIPWQVTNPYGGESAFVPSLYSAANAPQFNLSNGTLVAGTGVPFNGISLLGSGWPDLAKNYFQTLYNNPAYSTLFHNLPQGFTDTPKSNFAPRLGFAYDPFGTGKTALRGGFGLFYLRPTSNTLQYPSLNTPFVSSVTLLNNSFSNLNSTTVLNPQTVNTNETGTHKTTVVTSVNLGAQREISKRTMLAVGYVGTFGHHLPVALNLNQFPLGTLTPALHPTNAATIKNAQNSLRPYLGYGDIGLNAYVVNTNYHSLQATLKHQGGKGPSYGASYTFSKTMETEAARGVPQNSYDLKHDYSLSDIHRASILSVNAMYEIPFFNKSNHLLSAALGHWSLTTVMAYQSGSPLNICLPTDNAGIGLAAGLSQASACQRPNLSGDINKVSGTRTVSNWFNTAAASVPTAGTYGDGGRNPLIGPYYFQEDMSLTKRFAIKERINMEVKADCFNLYNHDSYTNVGTSMGTSTFGSITGSVPGRVFQLAMKAKF